VTEREKDDLHLASDCTITDTSVPDDEYTDPGKHSSTDRNRIDLIQFPIATLPKVISHIKHTVNSLLHLDERNKCCRSATTFSSVLFSLINVVRVSKRKS